MVLSFFFLTSYMFLSYSYLTFFCFNIIFTSFMSISYRTFYMSISYPTSYLSLSYPTICLSLSYPTYFLSLSYSTSYDDSLSYSTFFSNPFILSFTGVRLSCMMAPYAMKSRSVIGLALLGVSSTWG